MSNVPEETRSRVDVKVGMVGRNEVGIILGKNLF